MPPRSTFRGRPPRRFGLGQPGWPDPRGGADFNQDSTLARRNRTYFPRRRSGVKPSIHHRYSVVLSICRIAQTCEIVSKSQCSILGVARVIAIPSSRCPHEGPKEFSNGSRSFSLLCRRSRSVPYRGRDTLIPLIPRFRHPNNISRISTQQSGASCLRENRLKLERNHLQLP